MVQGVQRSRLDTLGTSSTPPVSLPRQWSTDPIWLNSYCGNNVYWASHVFQRLCWSFHMFYIYSSPAPHSSTLAWKILWIEEPGGLQSMGSRRVRHDWVTSFSLFTLMHWKRKWQPTPVFLPGESQGRRSLAGCRLWGCTEPDTTEVT